MAMTTWRRHLARFNDEIGFCTIPDEELDREFNNGYGLTQGHPFTAWSEEWVYFPVVYDGAEWVARVPRNPCHIHTDHVGGQ